MFWNIQGVSEHMKDQKGFKKKSRWAAISMGLFIWCKKGFGFLLEVCWHETTNYIQYCVLAR